MPKIIINGEEVELGGGSSIPPGGTTGQVIAKASDADGDVRWADAGSGEVYSTEEVRIGTWVDGKPIYRRCVIIDDASQFTVSSAVTTASINFDEAVSILNVSGRLWMERFEIGIGMYTNSSAYSYWAYYHETNILKIGTRYGSEIIKKCVAIIEYTKTTDVPSDVPTNI